MRKRCKRTQFWPDEILLSCPNCGIIMGCESEKGGYIECTMCPDQDTKETTTDFPDVVENIIVCMRCAGPPAY